MLNFNQKTSKLKLDLESQVSDVSVQLEDKSKELESQIASIDVSSSDFSSIIEDVTKAVVSVKTNRGQGSGVIFDSDGLVLTNKHVIDSASQIAVVDYNQKAYPVKIIGTAKNSDLAILEIVSNETFSRLKFASDSEIKVGSKVIAIGNPKGLSFTVTEGIISAINRKIDDTGIGYIQTDVSINSGNSGGPLVNAAKRIVGINTFKLVDSEGLGFAIPSSVAQDIANQAR